MTRHSTTSDATTIAVPMTAQVGSPTMKLRPR